MQNMLLVLHLLICVVLVGAVLMQRSEGGGLISGRGAADMMVNITSWVAGVFFLTSIGLTVLAGAGPTDRSVTDSADRSGIELNIPFLNNGQPAPEKSTSTAGAPAPAIAAPVASAPAEGAAVAPPPVQATTRAGPLPEAPPIGAAKAPPAGAAASKSGGASAGPLVAGPVGAVQQTTPTTTKNAPRPAPVTQKAAPVPLRPVQTVPSPDTASTTESPQDSDPGSTRDRSGPDE